MEILFQSTLAATTDSGENAVLVWVDNHLVALLLPAQAGWFLERGLGPCEREGMLFATLEAVEKWVRQRIPAGWRAPSDVRE